jgi:roundabout axon guidance receptor 2
LFGVICINDVFFSIFIFFSFFDAFDKRYSVRPVIVRPPQDTTALLGGDVTLECGVTGDPPPHVEWRRQDGAKIPINRIRPASNDQTRTSLRLERLGASDAGRYVCEVENSVGSSSASAQLAILIPV